MSQASAEFSKRLARMKTVDSTMEEVALAIFQHERDLSKKRITLSETDRRRALAFAALEAICKLSNDEYLLDLLDDWTTDAELAA